MNKEYTENKIEYLKTEYGIFTNNIELGLTAQEVYDKWLCDKENPQEAKPTLEDLVEKQANEITTLRRNDSKILLDNAKRVNDLKEVNKKNAHLLLDNAKKTTTIKKLNTNIANVTLEIAKIKMKEVN